MMGMEYKGVMVDRCSSCHGIWLDKAELDVVLAKKLGSSFDVGRMSQASVDTRDKPAHCPKCDKDMMVIEGAAGVVFDWCERCEGMFFDTGELRMIDEFSSD